jgi:tRNA threonylcarbamoyl adenosine modification protein (Sua5/YciO/YrdC/YwlC family)
VTVPVLPGLLPGGEPDPAVAAQVARAWLAGGLVGLPTETVYGLAADAQDPDAVARIYAAKGRPADHPVIVHVAGADAIRGWCGDDAAVAHRLAEAFWPGPLTVVVPRSARAGDFVTGGQDTVALRCPGHPVARACIAALAEASGDPARGVAAPSANRFGRVSPTRAADVVAELGDRFDPIRDLVVDGGPSAVGVESTIVDCTVDPPRVLRLGAISQAQVDAALAAPTPPPTPTPTPTPTPSPTPPLRDPFTLWSQEGPQGAWITEAVGGAEPGEGEPVGESGDGEPGDEGGREGVRAPGTLDSHYAPHARVLLVPSPGPPTSVAPESGDLEAFLRGHDSGLGTPGPDQAAEATGTHGSAGERGVGLIAPETVPTPDGWVRLIAPASAEAYARQLYAALRRADELGLDVVVAVLPDPVGGPLAEAVRDRLTRAAHPA